MKALLLPKTCPPQHWWTKVQSLLTDTHTCLLTGLLMHKYNAMSLHAHSHNFFSSCQVILMYTPPHLIPCSLWVFLFLWPLEALPHSTMTDCQNCPPCCSWAFSFWQLSINRQALHSFTRGQQGPTFKNMIFFIFKQITPYTHCIWHSSLLVWYSLSLYAFRTIGNRMFLRFPSKNVFYS